MTSPKYTFGYLFVRFAKIFALLVVLTGAGAILAWTGMHLSTAADMAYRKDQNLQRQLVQLEQEFSFATQEVGRLATVDDLAPLRMPGAPTNEEEFRNLEVALGAAAGRREELKRRLVESFEKKAGAIRQQLATFLEQRRPAPAENADSPAPAPLPLVEAAPSSARNVFGAMEPRDLGEARESLDDLAGFFLQLERSAEKDENRKLIHEAYSEVIRLAQWFPMEPKQVGSPASREPIVRETPAVPPNPFVGAEANLARIGHAIQIVRRHVTTRWELDARLDETTAILESEQDQYRASVAAIRADRNEWLTRTGISLVATLVLAFTVLVAADWMRSFFDTASHAGRIREIMERQAASTGVNPDPG